MSPEEQALKYVPYIALSFLFLMFAYVYSVTKEQE